VIATGRNAGPEALTTGQLWIRRTDALLDCGGPYGGAQAATRGAQAATRGAQPVIGDLSDFFNTGAASVVTFTRVNRIIGPLVRPGEQGYDEERLGLNRAVESRPAYLMGRPATRTWRPLSG
jgi:hypothetical protein